MDSEEDLKDYQNKVFELNAELQLLTKFLEKEYPDYFELKYKNKQTSIEEVRAALPNGTCLVEFMLGVENAYAFFLTKELIEIVEIADGKTIDVSIQKIRDLVSHPPNNNRFKKDQQELTTLLHAVYKQLIATGLNVIDEKIVHLVIVPDDVLCYLPFELLLKEPANANRISYSPEVLSYLFEDVNISYQYSASLMATRQVNENALGEHMHSFVGYAPKFEGDYAMSRICNEDQLYSLQCNQKEVAAISSIMDGVSYLSTKANIQEFKKSAPSSRIVHLATHACVDDSGNGLSKIYLADGNLTHFDLGGLNLQTDLAVLSACNTGMGQLLKGEGMLSLTRSFMQAGSKSVLTSMWSVDDCATADIMVQYYQALIKGCTKDEALVQAKLNYLSTADRHNSHPYYWGAFVHFGYMEAMYASPLNKWYIGTAIFILLGGLFYFRKK